MANLVSQKAKMTFSLAGKARPNKPNKALLDAIQGAVTKSLGPGYSVNVYSGQENAGHQHGSNRHGTGFAADVHVVGPDGKTLNARENKQQLLDVAKAFKELGGLGIGLGTDYMGGNGIHLDMVEAGPGQDNAWGNIGNAMQGWLDSFSRSQIAASTPDEMQAPMSLAQSNARDSALAAAFGSPSRALDVPQASALAFNAPSRPRTMNPPARFPGVPVGKVTRAPLDAIPASLTPAPVGRVERAPLGPVGQFAGPARSLQHPTSVAKPTNLVAAPVGQVTKGPALAPAKPNASTLAAQYSQYQPSKTTSMPTVVGMPSTPAPTGLPAAKPSPATLAAQYAQYQKMPGAVPPAPIAPVAVPPAPVLAPMLAPPTVVKDYPVANVPAAPPAPRATAYDVYNGLADSALDNTGKNTVSRDAFGNTVVENQFGAKTAMTPQGYQSAYGGIPGGSLPGIKGPSLGKFGTAVKGAVPGFAGSAVGGLLGGPLGALLGGALAKAATQPGGILSGVNSFQTDYFGQLNAAKPSKGGAFPDAPKGGYKGSASFSNRSENDMRDISPAAARDISRGLGGLY